MQRFNLRVAEYFELEESIGADSAEFLLHRFDCYQFRTSARLERAFQSREKAWWDTLETFSHSRSLFEEPVQKPLKIHETS